jgi:hypothetical protein
MDCGGMDEEPQEKGKVRSLIGIGIVGCIGKAEKELD